jgi:hypothetical protein
MNMMKHLRTLGLAAAALAASAGLFAAAGSAFAQEGRELDGAPRLFSGQDYDRDRDYNRDRDRDWNNDRNRKPDFQHVQRECSREAIREAWNRNYYSAQYHDGPRLEHGRYGWEMRGRMRLHDRKGYHYADSYCDIDRNNRVRIEFRNFRR